MQYRGKERKRESERERLNRGIENEKKKEKAPRFKLGQCKLHELPAQEGEAGMVKLCILKLQHNSNKNSHTFIKSAF